MRSRRSPIRVRLTLWFGSWLAALLILLGIVAPYWLAHDLDRRNDESLRSAVAELVASGVDRHQLVPGDERESDFVVQLVDSTGAVVASNRTDVPAILAGSQELLASARRGQTDLHTLVPEGSTRTYRVVAAPVPDGDVVVLSEPLSEVEEAVGELRVMLWFAIPVLIVLSAAGIWVLTRSALRPISSMVARADRITADRLRDRIEQPGAQDELGRLAQTLNRMLARIELGVEEKQRLVADASHELRTPLTLLSFELEMLRAREVEPALRAGLDRVDDAADRMRRMVEDLLTLARFDGGSVELLRRTFDLGQEIRTVIDRFASAAQLQGVDIGVYGESAEVFADRERVDQVVVNLVDNALKYGAGAEIAIRLSLRENDIKVAVIDDGPGIEPPEQERIFDRFHRGPSTNHERGSGLGLAICATIVRSHGGQIWVECPPGGGSRFCFTLPLARHASGRD